MKKQHKNILKIFFILIAGIALYIYLTWPLPKLDIADLQGQDKDGNGVRDDIDEYIDTNYKDINLRKALRQEGRYAREAFKYIDDPERFKQAESYLLS